MVDKDSLSSNNEQQSVPPNEESELTDSSAGSVGDVGSLETPPTAGPLPAINQPTKPRFSLVRLLGRLNPYLLGFSAILLIALVVLYFSLGGDRDSLSISLGDDEITQELLEKLAAGETNIGDNSQTLTVEANTIFNGRVLVKDSIDVAGSINVGGALSLPGITVSGNSTFDDIEVSNSLAILGNTSIQGTLSVISGLSVDGGGIFAGALAADSLSTNSLELLGDLRPTRHINTGGPSPTISAGGSIGSGGTVSLSGTDTSGTITLNTGASASPGVLASVTFRRSFTSTPQVILSPVNSSAATLLYYAQRNTTSFTVRTVSDPADSSTFIFDYFVLE